MSRMRLERHYHCWNDCQQAGCPGHTAILEYQSVTSSLHFSDGKSQEIYMQTPELEAFLSMLHEPGESSLEISNCFPQPAKPGQEAVREAKVRAWDTQANTWVEGLTLTIHTSGRLLRVPEHIILTWSTGLTDKSGKDIFEGDIIQLTYERRHKQETSEVYYDERKACYGPFHHFVDDEDRWMDVDYEVEIVGNIWENS